MAKYVATTPTQVTPAISAFCGGEPVYLEIRPDKDAALGRCYDNAASAAECLGGKVVHGWLVWELPGVYLTAEHHAVVEVDGELVDLSPTLAGERRVLFYPDQTPFPPPRANRYYPLTTDARIIRSLQLQQANSGLELAGKAFGPAYMRNDDEATRLLDAYLSSLEVRRVRDRLRAAKKAVRKRRKRR